MSLCRLNLHVIELLMCTRNKIWHVKAELKKDLLAKKYLKLKIRCSTTKKKGWGGRLYLGYNLLFTGILQIVYLSEKVTEVSKCSYISQELGKNKNKNVIRHLRHCSLDVTHIFEE